ncbi:HxlR family transcriptional regulator [Nocardioides sp. Root190]|uniref:winged helix-turn-helix transcriptional regulator n=1 Tax=Nocardioides sp. Root190 TaxID=1736488 RepID=UPI0006F78F5A|nr:helix-turn-helix domain-containing protein [Nocardioides sp. Root190]KRB76443.1 HxlR family transcriptional regulator [Nocardioides sp. Root190]
MKLEERLQDRTQWTTAGRCPVERAMGLVGSRNAMLAMREAFYGTTRFDDFAERVGMSPATTSSNLKALTEAGLLERRPYREAGTRTRDEYVLTEAGVDLMPVVLALFAWGSRHAGETPGVDVVHAGCGEAVEVRATCAGGHQLESDDVELRVRSR